MVYTDISSVFIASFRAAWIHYLNFCSTKDMFILFKIIYIDYEL